MTQPIIVVVAGGKGGFVGSDAYWFTVNLFDTIEEAEKYVAKNTDIESKHWKRASIVKEGNPFEVAYDGFYIN